MIGYIINTQTLMCCYACLFNYSFWEEVAPGKDFDPIDTIVEFKKEHSKQVEVIIHDDDQWEPDKEFKVVLY